MQLKYLRTKIYYNIYNIVNTLLWNRFRVYETILFIYLFFVFTFLIMGNIIHFISYFFKIIFDLIHFNYIKFYILTIILYSYYFNYFIFQFLLSIFIFFIFHLFFTNLFTILKVEKILTWVKFIFVKFK